GSQIHCAARTQPLCERSQCRLLKWPREPTQSSPQAKPQPLLVRTSLLDPPPTSIDAAAASPGTIDCSCALHTCRRSPERTPEGSLLSLRPEALEPLPCLTDQKAKISASTSHHHAERTRSVSERLWLPHPLWRNSS